MKYAPILLVMASSEDKTIGAAPALINKIQTTIDGGFRITLDVTDQETSLVKALIDLKASNGELFVAFVRKVSSGL